MTILYIWMPQQNVNFSDVSLKLGFLSDEGDTVEIRGSDSASDVRGV